MSIATTPITFQEEYAALHEGAVVQVRARSEVLQVTGADGADFLHRMTTNDLKKLQSGQSAVTVMTSPVARILSVFTVLCRPDELWLLPPEGEAKQLAARLRGQIFFMDQVQVDDVSDAQQRLRVMGPVAGEILAPLGFDLRSAGEGAFIEHDGALAVKQMQYDVPGYEVVAARDRLQSLLDDLVQAGARVLTDESAYEVRRVEMGRPAASHELIDDFTPLEAGLAWSCAEDKGCYTGQEIIARQITYDKVTRTLAGLVGDETFVEGAQVEAEGLKAGVVTSAAVSPRLGKPIALAVIKRPHNAPGSTVTVGGQEAAVVELPMV